MKNKSAVSDDELTDVTRKAGLADEAERAAFRDALLEWFDGHRRELPWRGVDDPYAVWVSEVMLQQTRVETVVDYFQRWMERFPTVQQLADAPIEEVLELWSGLGYYRRARYLHRSACELVEDHDGSLPSTVNELKQLPGIGPYTAGAIASIAFDRCEPLVDGNVMRVISRLYTIEGKPRREPANSQIWQCAEELVDPNRPGDFNQALMELGSEVCTPDSPACLICSVRQWCQAHATGDPQQFPDTRDRPEQKPMRARSCVIDRNVGDKREFLLRRRSRDGLLGGLWEFPSFECEGEDWPRLSQLEELVEGYFDGLAKLEIDDAIGNATHVFSHRRLQVKVHRLCIDDIEVSCEERRDGQDWRWVGEEQLDEVASAALLDKIYGVWTDQR